MIIRDRAMVVVDRNAIGITYAITDKSPEECVLSNEWAHWWISNFNHDSWRGEMLLRSSRWIFLLRFLVFNSIWRFLPFAGAFDRLQIPFNDFLFYERNVCVNIESKPSQTNTLGNDFPSFFNTVATDEYIKYIQKNRKIPDKRCHQFPSTRSLFTHFKIDFIVKFITPKAATEADSRSDGISKEIARIYSVNDIINFFASARELVAKSRRRVCQTIKFHRELKKALIPILQCSLLIKQRVKDIKWKSI